MCCAEGSLAVSITLTFSSRLAKLEAEAAKAADEMARRCEKINEKGEGVVAGVHLWLIVHRIAQLEKELALAKEGAASAHAEKGRYTGYAGHSCGLCLFSCEPVGF